MWMKGLLAGTTKQAFGDVQIREGSWDRDPVRLVWAEDVPDLREGVIRFRLRQRAVLDVPCALALVRAGREGPRAGPRARGAHVDPRHHRRRQPHQ